ncbi:MAG: hypothetical protein ACRYGP_24550 [Janthinobacterium lividum]
MTLQLGKGDPAVIARLVEIMRHDTMEALPELVDRLAASGRPD